MTDTLKAGRELDAEVAKVVLKKRVTYIATEPSYVRADESSPLGFVSNFGGKHYTRDHDWIGDDWLDIDEDRELAHYSTDIAAAFAVVERMRELGWQFEIICYSGRDGGFTVSAYQDAFQHPKGLVDSSSDTLPEAICKCALAAVGERTTR
jgi:hypothetical protein